MSPPSPSPPRTRRPLPAVVETKETRGGARKTVTSELVERSQNHAIVLFISPSSMQVDKVALPAGTATFGFFWTDRPFNVYHWMSPAGSTLGIYFNVSDRTRIAPDNLSVTWRDLALDILVLPGGQVSVLDEDDIPPDLDGPTRAFIANAKESLLHDAPALTREVETTSSRLWPSVFGGARP
jgi:hypothetical protein